MLGVIRKSKLIMEYISFFSTNAIHNLTFAEWHYSPSWLLMLHENTIAHLISKYIDTLKHTSYRYYTVILYASPTQRHILPIPTVMA